MKKQEGLENLFLSRPKINHSLLALKKSYVPIFYQQGIEFDETLVTLNAFSLPLTVCINGEEKE